MVMWSKFLRFIPEDSISVAEWQHLIGTDSKSTDMWLTRLSKWGYIVIDSKPASSRSKRILSDAFIRLTPGGHTAVAVWRMLTATIEERWQERFGRNEIERLKNFLAAVACQLDPGLPDHLPILAYGLFTDNQNWKGEATPSISTLRRS